MFSESKWITFQISHQTESRKFTFKARLLEPPRPASRQQFLSHLLLFMLRHPLRLVPLCGRTPHYASWQLFHSICSGKGPETLLQKQKCSTPLAPFIGFLPCKLGHSEHPATNLFQGRIYRGKNPKQCSQYFFVIKNLCSKYVAIS